eukprot:357867-Chlamydomonas_euryale.AAC.1
MQRTEGGGMLCSGDGGARGHILQRQRRGGGKLWSGHSAGSSCVNRWGCTAGGRGEGEGGGDLLWQSAASMHGHGGGYCATTGVVTVPWESNGAAGARAAGYRSADGAALRKYVCNPTTTTTTTTKCYYYYY